VSHGSRGSGVPASCSSEPRSNRSQNWNPASYDSSSCACNQGVYASASLLTVNINCSDTIICQGCGLKHFCIAHTVHVPIPAGIFVTEKIEAHRFISKLQQLFEELRLVQDYEIQLLRTSRLTGRDQQ